MSLKQEEKTEHNIPEENEIENKPIRLKNYVEEASDKDIRKILDYLFDERNNSQKISLGIASFIVSPGIMILGAGLSYYIPDSISMFIAFGGLFGFIALGVYLSVKYGDASKHNLSKLERIFINEGIKDYIEEVKENNRPELNRKSAIGIALCILSPLFAMIPAFFNISELWILVGLFLMFIDIAAGVYLIVSSSMINGIFRRILRYEK
ncbi:MAG: hypothetical protein Q4D13_02820 [Erysipelotrichaceae bacterium]|nr:hypothetical protein [Erysipelotrichaceae bacterium]